METDVAGALAEFRKEVEAHPQHWPSLILIGSLEIRQGAVEAAIQSLRRAMKIAPPAQRWVCRRTGPCAHDPG